jgi:mono/diheme cytochrome c family protein
MQLLVPHSGRTRSLPLFEPVGNMDAIFSSLIGSGPLPQTDYREIVSLAGRASARAWRAILRYNARQHWGSEMRFRRLGMLLVYFGLVAVCSGQPPTRASVSFARTPQRVARGKYLVALAHCFDCHSERDSKGNQVHGMEGGGRVLSPEESNIPLPHFLVCPNITPERETGAGSWSDADLARAIREGIGRDGRILDKTMPYWNFRYLTDEDLASIVVYLRSIPAVRHPVPKRNLAVQPVIDWRTNVQPAPLSSNAPAAAQRGEYLVHIGTCTGCHTSADPQGHPIPGMLFAGGRVFVRPWGTAASANLTRDPSGIGYYDDAQFIRTIRTGHVGARALNRTMPYPLYGNLTDEDLKAIFAYLRTLPPVVHRVDNTEPPTLCPKCNNRHGFGSRN